MVGKKSPRKPQPSTELDPFSKAIRKQSSKYTTELSAVELASLVEESYQDDALFFGDDALDNFWELYKSDRRFKDFEESDEISDPRFAYLKMCHDLQVYPKARMIIREKKTTYIDYSNYCMLNKSAVAVAEAIKRYALTIESINLQNNGLKSKQCKLLIDSLHRHYPKLQILNLRKNRLGY